MPTVCRDCAHLSDTAKGQPWWRWLCTAARLEPEWNPVTGQYDREGPYAKCKALNRGDCSEFEAGPNCLQPREMPK